MADFDAGSIEGRLELDRDPFRAGLEAAQDEGRDFEANEFVATIGVDTDHAHEEIDELDARLDELETRDPTVHVDVDTEHAREEIDSLKSSIGNNTNDSGSLMGKLGLLGGVLKGIVPVGVATGIASLPGLLAAAGGAAIGAGGAFGIAGLGVLGFGLLAKSQFTDMQATLKDVTKQQEALNSATTDAQRQAALKALAADTAKLQGPAGLAAAAYTQLQGAVTKLKSDTAPAVFGVMAQFFGLATAVIPKITPFLNATGSALSGVVGQLGLAFSSQGFTQFMTFLSTEIGPVLANLTSGSVSFFGGLATALEKSAPLIDLFVKGWAELGTKVSTFTASPEFTQLIDFMVKELPIVGQTVAPILGLIVDILKTLGPAVGPALGFIQALAGALDSLVTGPAGGAIVSLFMGLITAITPILPLAAQLINGLFSPLSTILLVLLPPLSQLVQTLLPPLTSLFGQLAPVIVPLVDQLATGLAPIIKELGPLLQALIPLILPVAKGFGDVVHIGLSILLPALRFIIPLITSLANFLRPMAPVIEVLAGAFLAWTAAQWLLNIALDANPIGLIILAVAALALGITYLVTHWREVVTFLNGPWGTAISAIIAGILPFIGIPMLIIGHWQTLESWFSGAFGWLINTGKMIINGLLSGIEAAWGTVSLWWNNVYGWVTGFFSSAGNWLYNIGHAILTGLLNGLKSAWNSVTSFVGGIGGWITSHKGPIEVDRQLLVPHGLAIMAGLGEGINTGFVGVQRDLTGMANKIKNTNFGGTGNLSLTGTAQLALNTQAQLTAMGGLAGQIAQLAAQQAAPEDIGQAVADKLKPVLKDQTRDQHERAQMRDRRGALVGGS